MNVSDLSDVATFDFNGNSFGAQFMQMGDKHKTYLAVSSQNGTFQYGFDSVMGSTSSTLSIYRLKHGVLTLKTSSDLPQIANWITVKMSDCGHALIGASTRRAIIGNSIFVSDSNHASFGDHGHELRVYSFDGHKLELSLAKKTNITTSGPTFNSNSDLILVNEQLNDGDPSFFNLYNFCKSSGLQFADGLYGAPSWSQSMFSGDGEWLLIAGSDQDSNLNNINLYKVSNC